MERGQRGQRDRAVARDQQREVAGGERVVHLPARLQQAATAVLQRLAPVLAARLLGRPDEARLDAERLGQLAHRRGIELRDPAEHADRCQRPFHCGSLFSKNAWTPSTMSSVESASVRFACRYSSASRNAMSCWRNIASLPRRMISGDFEASLAAHSSTAAWNSSAATTLLTMPASLASCAETRSP